MNKKGGLGKELNPRSPGGLPQAVPPPRRKGRPAHQSNGAGGGRSPGTPGCTLTHLLTYVLTCLHTCVPAIYIVEEKPGAVKRKTRASQERLALKRPWI
jgi:hypothetical protein